MGSINIATDGRRLFTATIVGGRVAVNDTATTQTLPLPLMEVAIAVSPQGQVAVTAKTRENRAFGSVDFNEWIELGPVFGAQSQYVAWVEDRFLFARTTGNSLVEQDATGRIVASRSVVTSQGILSYEDRWVLTDERINRGRGITVGQWTLLKPVNRGKWWCGQKVGRPDVTFVTDGVRGWTAGGQVETPALVLLPGDTLACLVPGGVNTFAPPYPPTEPVTPRPGPEPEPDPEPEPEPDPMEMPTAVLATVRQFAAAFPPPQGQPGAAHEDRCRQWTRKLAEQLRFTHGASWGHKSAGSGRPPSKDGIARKTDDRFDGWDLLVGAGTGRPKLAANPAWHDLTGQHFIPVPAVNHLQQPEPTEPPDQPDPPPPSDPTDTARILAVLNRLEIEQAALRGMIQGAHTKLDLIDAKQHWTRGITLSLPFLGTATGKVGGVEESDA